MNDEEIKGSKVEKIIEETIKAEGDFLWIYNIKHFYISWKKAYLIQFKIWKEKGNCFLISNKTNYEDMKKELKNDFIGEGFNFNNYSNIINVGNGYSLYFLK